MLPQSSLQFSARAEMNRLLSPYFLQLELILSFGKEKPQTFVTLHTARLLRTYDMQVARFTANALPMLFFNRFLLNDFKSFNPLFKVLFIFPSQYLFAIGFP